VRAAALLLALSCSGLLTLSAAAETPARSGLTRLLEGAALRFPAKVGIYAKHLKTGEEAGVRDAEPFSSMSVIKIPIMVLAFRLSEQGKLNLDERIEIRRSHLRDGSGIFQYHDLGLQPTLRDLITQMIITSDNTATDLVLEKVGGLGAVNDWLRSAGYSNTRIIGSVLDFRRKSLGLMKPEFERVGPDEAIGLVYAIGDNPLFEKFADVFTGEKRAWIDLARDPEQRRRYNRERNQRVSNDPSFWLGSMTPRETGRMLEAIEQETIASKQNCQIMKVIMRRQLAGARRIPHYLDVAVGHKTGDSASVANDVGIVYARSGSIVLAFFTSGIRDNMGETEDRIGQVSRQIVDYFDGAPQPSR
jgi:beta-lactamase class A